MGSKNDAQILTFYIYIYIPQNIAMKSSVLSQLPLTRKQRKLALYRAHEDKNNAPAT